MDKYFLILYCFTVEYGNEKVISFKTSLLSKSQRNTVDSCPVAGGWNWMMLCNPNHSVILYFHNISFLKSTRWKNKKFTVLTFLRKPKSIIFFYHCVLTNKVKKKKKIT